MQITAAASAASYPANPDISYDYPHLLNLQLAGALPNQHPVETEPGNRRDRKAREVPLFVRANKILRAATVAMWTVALVGYGLDVSLSNEVSKLQDQARRLSEQNTDLSARLLKAISFQGIQDSTLGKFGLRVPEQVLIIKEIPPTKAPAFHPQKHHLPLMPGF